MKKQPKKVKGFRDFDNLMPHLSKLEKEERRKQYLAGGEKPTRGEKPKGEKE